LFRLPHETEFRIHRLAFEVGAEQIIELLNPQKAESHLRKVAGTVTPASGPIKVGSLDRALTETSTPTLAGHYLAAIESGQPAFPYFA
jgi:hypothetical protein